MALLSFLCQSAEAHRSGRRVLQIKFSFKQLQNTGSQLSKTCKHIVQAGPNERRRQGKITLRSVSEDQANAVGVSAVVLMDPLERQK